MLFVSRETNDSHRSGAGTYKLAPETIILILFLLLLLTSFDSRECAAGNQLNESILS